MQATPADYSNKTYQQSQEKSETSDLNTSTNNNSSNNEERSQSSSEKEVVKKPVIVSKPVAEKMNIFATDTKKDEDSAIPVSPRGFKPLARLQLPESSQKQTKSPRSPRNDLVRNDAETALQSPHNDEIIKMADSLSDAYRAFGSPRKEQPKPRRLESQRSLQTETTINQETITSTITTATITTTSTAEKISPPTQSGATLSSVVNDTSTPYVAEDISNTFLFIKARRRISMSKILVPESDISVSTSSHRIPVIKYSKEAQMEVLASMVVADCAENSINPKDMGSLGRLDVELDPDQLPAELVEYKVKLKEKNKPATNHLMHAIFWSEFESGDAWIKAMAINHQLIMGNFSATPRSGQFDDGAEKHLSTMLDGFAKDFALCLFKSPSTLASLGVPEDLKKFLFIADQKFFSKLLEQDSRAIIGDKGFHTLTKKISINYEHIF